MGEVRALMVPPHSVDAEQALLGLLLLDQQVWHRMSGQVVEEDFYRADHRVIFAACEAVADAGGSPDAVAVRDHLARHGQLEQAGGRDYLAELIEAAGSAPNVATYAATVRDQAVLRSLHSTLTEHTSRIHRQPQQASVHIGEALQALIGLTDRGRSGRGLVSAQKLVGELIDDLDRRRDGERGLSIGLPDFDALSSGLEPGDLVVLAGRPGMGKTALLVSIAAHVARTASVAIYSAEMTSLQLLKRALALVTGIPQNRFRRVELLEEIDWSVIESGTAKLAQRRLWIDDTPSPTLAHVRAETMAARANGPIGLVMVDYVQLVQGTGRNRADELRDVAYGLKGLAKDIGAPIILLAQLNRGVESRDNKRPRLSDLRDSGSIEEAADFVGMLYSEGYYDPEHGMPYVLECLIEKNRHGERGECLWHFSGEFSRVGTLDDGAKAQYRRLRASKRRSVMSDDDL